MISLLVVGLVTLPWACMMRMPGSSHEGPLPPLTADEAAYRDQLRRHVDELAVKIGERNATRPAALSQAADYVEAELRQSGLGVTRRPYDANGQTFVNIEAVILASHRGNRLPPIVVVGAHYDSAIGTPAANDNASGVAALLVLARAAAAKTGGERRPDLDLYFVAFANEEPPHFQKRSMGSWVYAEHLADAGQRVRAMLSLETIGYYRDEPGSQRYPFPLSVYYPSVGNFVGVVGDRSSSDLVRHVVGEFRSHTQFPSEGAALPAAIPGVGWSDHWSFWQIGYPAVMVTDTAPFRYPHYHTPEDTPDKIDFERLARVTAGLGRVIDQLAGVR